MNALIKLQSEIAISVFMLRAKLTGGKLKVGKNPRVFVGSSIRVTNGGCVEIGDDFTLGQGAEINVNGGHLKIGNHFQLLSHANLNCMKEIEIGNNVAFAPFVFVTDFDHDYNLPFDERKTAFVFKPCKFNDCCWVGAHSVVLKGVTLGKYAGVGANSTVNESVDDYTLVVGKPAKPVKVFDFAEDRQQSV